jgi:hypothetical protein
MIVQFTTYLVNQKATYETRRVRFDKIISESEWIQNHLDKLEKYLKEDQWKYVIKTSDSITYGNGYVQTRIEYRIR